VISVAAATAVGAVALTRAMGALPPQVETAREIEAGCETRPVESATRTETE